jgi:hypothetical protein
MIDKLSNVSLDLISYDDCFQSSYEKGNVRWVLPPPNLWQPIAGKGAVTIAYLLRCFPAHLFQWPIELYYHWMSSMWGYRRHTPSANDIACFLHRFVCRDCSCRSDQAEGFIYTEPQFWWWDLAQPTISGLVLDRWAIAPYASPPVRTWAALIITWARLSIVSTFLIASKLSSGRTGLSSETIRWSLFASYLFIICRKTLWWNWWKLGW